MDLSLTRVDLCQLGTVSHRNTLTLLPKGKNPKQKFVVGEDSGRVQCFRIKRGDIDQTFEINSNGCEVDAIALGGPVEKKDRIFVCRSNVVEGFSKAGKRFFKFNTQLSDPLMNMAIAGRQIYCIQNYVYSMFEDAKDKEFFVSPDCMNALVVEHVTTDDNAEVFDAVVGCEDSHIRIISGSELLLKAVTSGPVKTLSRYGVDEFNGKRSETAAQKCVIYGTSNGAIGQMLIKSSSTVPSLRQGWLLQPSKREAKVNCIHSFDMTMDDVHDIVVGRDDGQIQIFGFDMGTEPSLQYQTTTSESCCSVKVR